MAAVAVRQEARAAGEKNKADLTTKHLTGAVVAKHINNLNLECRRGRAEQEAQLFDDVPARGLDIADDHNDGQYKHP